MPLFNGPIQTITGDGVRRGPGLESISPTGQGTPRYVHLSGAGPTDAGGRTSYNMYADTQNGGMAQSVNCWWDEVTSEWVATAASFNPTLFTFSQGYFGLQHKSPVAGGDRWNAFGWDGLSELLSYSSDSYDVIALNGSPTGANTSGTFVDKNSTVKAWGTMSFLSNPTWSPVFVSQYNMSASLTTSNLLRVTFGTDFTQIPVVVGGGTISGRPLCVGVANSTVGTADIWAYDLEELRLNDTSARVSFESTQVSIWVLAVGENS